MADADFRMEVDADEEDEEENGSERPDQAEMEAMIEEDMEEAATAAAELASDPLQDEEVEELLTTEIPPPPSSCIDFEGTGKQLCITHVIVENFKSYFGRHILGPFHRNFTCVVGPNGSGKSNVIDALLFVFGYRAQKIRCKNMQVLIHHSDKHPDVDSCSVEVYFGLVSSDDAAATELPEPTDDEFVVSRTVDRQNNSYYCLNNKLIQFKELATWLRRSGIDLDHNRFLILQGEVEQIALMKPKAETEGEEGMLEYLEDIIGSSRLKGFIQKLDGKVNKFYDIWSARLNRLRVVDTELKDMEERKSKAVEFLRRENDITRKKNLLFYAYLYHAEEEYDVAKSRWEEERKRFEDGEKELQGLLQQAKKFRAELERTRKAKDAKMAEMDTLKKKWDDVENKDLKFREDMKHGRARMKKLQSSLDAERKKLEELKEAPAKIAANIEKLQNKLDPLQKKRTALEASMNAALKKLNEQTKDLQKEIEVHEQKLLSMQTEVNVAKSQFELAKSELELYLAAQGQEAKKLDDLQSSFKKANETVRDGKEKLRSVEQQVIKVKNEVEQGRNRLKQLITDEATLTAEVRRKKRAAEEARSAMEGQKSRSAVLNSLFEQKRLNNIPGIYGRLGDLGAIDEMYDVAISTACGALDNIVVDTIDTAQACVEFLKSNNVGQATFIALNKMDRFKELMAESIKTPENVKRLFDLIRVENADLLPAFYFALRNTLVANNLDQATRIALQGKSRWRVVTLQGDLIDISGTMTGGGKEKRRGRMGQRIVRHEHECSAKDVKRLEEAAGKDAAELDKVRLEKATLEERINALLLQTTSHQLEVTKLKMEIDAAMDEVTALREQISQQEVVVKNTVVDEKKTRELEENVKQLEQVFKEKSDRSAKVEEMVQNLQAQIQKVEEKLVGSIKNDLASTTTAFNKAQSEINKLTASNQATVRDIGKSEKKLQTIEKEVEECQKKIDDSLQQLKDMEEDASSLLDEMEITKVAVVKMIEELKVQEETIKEQEAAEQNLKKASIDRKGKVTDAEKVLNEASAEIEGWKKEISRLTLHDLREIDPETAKHLCRRHEKAQEEKEAAAKAGRSSGDGDENGPENDAPSFGQFLDEGVFEMLVPPPEVVSDINKKKYSSQVSVAEKQLRGFKVDLNVINLYKKKRAKREQINKEVKDAEQIMNRVKARFDQLRKQRLTEFKTAFDDIAMKVKEMYQLITIGGDADLECADSVDPFSEGIVFSVRPPQKTWKQITNLSGGEKTLSSLSLIFALHNYQPTPLYVMDEIDAALDFRNVSIVANYIKTKTKNAQFIIISLRNNMFELADRLLGIYKTYNCTKSLALDAGHFKLPFPERKRLTFEFEDSEPELAAPLRPRLDPSIPSIS